MDSNIFGLNEQRTDLNRMYELREELIKANEDYRNGNESMSNFEYDKKYDELRALEDVYGNIRDEKGLSMEFYYKCLNKKLSVKELVIDDNCVKKMNILLDAFNTNHYSEFGKFVPSFHDKTTGDYVIGNNKFALIFRYDKKIDIVVPVSLQKASIKDKSLYYDKVYNINSKNLTEMAYKPKITVLPKEKKNVNLNNKSLNFT